MKRVVCKPFWNPQSEEKWINDMSAKGLALVGRKPFRHVFDSAAPGEYVYRMDLLKESPAHPESRAYLDLVRETGAEVVATCTRWVYFRKKADGAPFLIYSDIPSQIAYNKRLRAGMLFLGIINLLIGESNIQIGVSQQPVIVVNLLLGIVCALLGVASLWTYTRIGKKLRALKKEQRIRES